MGDRTARSRGRVALVIVTLVGAAGAAAGGYAVGDGLRGDSDPAQRAVTSVPSVPSVLSGATRAPASSPVTTDARAPRAASVAAALAERLADPALGRRLLAQVLDARTGTVLFARSAATPAAPASTAKLLTAAAVLGVHPGTYRITTKVVAGGPGTVVLVGGGDPTLTGAAGDEPGAYPNAARLADLAAGVKAQNVTVRRVVVDGSAFTGPAVSPDWAAEDIPSDYAAPITAVTLDGGRSRPGDTIRSTAPDLAAGRRLAELLGVPGAEVTRGSAPPGATTLATVRSAPLSELVEQMLQTSDNVIAEALARQVAVAVGRPADFLGAARAVRQVLATLGVEVGSGMHDASGLSPSDRVSASTLTAVLRLITGPQQPQLHDIVTGLPVAGWSGTLRDRYLPSSAAAGVVRAKTGTLTSVSALAGLVHDQDGRLLVFALIADRVPAGVAATDAAEGALDRLAAALARCGCS